MKIGANPSIWILLRFFPIPFHIGIFVLLVFGLFLHNDADAGEPKTIHVGILSISDIRKNALEGFVDDLTEHAAQENVEYLYDIKDAAGKFKDLASLADQLVGNQPDILIAAGGVEADALRVATAQSKIPVIFLVVSSAVDRGLAESMSHPGGNLTGIDTNDTVLTEKRLWYISKLFPGTRRVLSFNVPTITPSVDSVTIAKEKAPALGVEFRVIDVNSIDDIKRMAATVTRENTDAIMLNPCAPVSQALKTVLLPLSLEQKIPILGYSRGDIENGAVAAYGPSRYGIGKQGAHMAIKVLRGASPSIVPIEPPENMELIINRHMVERLGLTLSNRAWKLANDIVNIEQ